MDHDSDREVEGALRTLLASAASDGPPETDLLGEVRRRVRRRRLRLRLLVPSLATLCTASVIAAATLGASVVTGTPSAQARVAAAAERTSRETYRVRIVHFTIDRAGRAKLLGQEEGFFDPARRTGRLLRTGFFEGTDFSQEVRYVGDLMYEELGDKSQGKRWSVRRRFKPDPRVPTLRRLAVLARSGLDPQQELVRVKSAATVREQGPVSGPGWSGRRYTYELIEENKVPRENKVTGTVDVDRAGRVRRLEVVSAPTSTMPGNRIVLEFRDFGAREVVQAPPAAEVIDQEAPTPRRPAPRR